eukprot:CAMPEP_0113885084 /NCGR_PEP_ID=MMETSP0780_2-20120614/10689_1 /TAXON_ID=652834 /ORGANISM="Palpitomonas bilix" /LENGTH=437 /DNA_ID=CAMNT_0000872921 /DNA_START=36 /DNA_END=1349 /DNA_ORIENTATION=+ /assembly_acc=CAM_ASM_000599
MDFAAFTEAAMPIVSTTLVVIGGVLAVLIAGIALLALYIGFDYFTSPAADLTSSDSGIIFRDTAGGKQLKSKYGRRKMPFETLEEAYVDEDIEIEGDLYKWMEEKRLAYCTMAPTFNQIKFFLTHCIPDVLNHSKSHDKAQVTEHYNRGNDFFGWFLGPSMVYTSGYYKDLASENLERAQENKLQLVCQKMMMKKGERHLDIGCGWGTMVIYAAKNCGTDSTGVTLAQEQVDFGMARIQKLGLSETCRMIVRDYRDSPPGPYDKITCIEMAEHVGVRKFQPFLALVKSLMTDNGLFYMQVSGLRRAWQWEDLSWGLFMNKYVFPGADASTPVAWYLNELERAGFEIHSEETVGKHYSFTLLAWYENWLSNKEDILKAYGMRWYRLWAWFLAWSVIAAGQGSASCYQIVAHKNTNEFPRESFFGSNRLGTQALPSSFF